MRVDLVVFGGVCGWLLWLVWLLAVLIWVCWLFVDGWAGVFAGGCFAVCFTSWWLLWLIVLL